MPFGRRGRASTGDASIQQAAEPHLQYPMLGNGLHVPLRADAFEQVLESVRLHPQPDAEDVFHVDWSGIRTRIPMLTWAPQELAGTTSSALPIPTDGYRSEAEEYLSLILSLESERSDYLAIEVGAGWAPWAVAGIVFAKRMGKHARGIAVEADPVRAGWAMQHAADNGISALLVHGDAQSLPAHIAAARDSAELLVVQAACWSSATTLRFPTLTDDDMGGAVQADRERTMDYRGAFIDHVDVPTVTLEALLGDQVVDLLHVDMQGQELEVLMPGTELIEQRVRFLAVGTHNRYVEGMLMHHLLPREWALLLESPSTAIFDGVRPSLTGFTVQDGNQLWANSRFRDAADVILR